MEKKTSKEKSDILEIPTVEGKYPIEIVNKTKKYKITKNNEL